MQHPYTVLMLVPDYATDNYGQDTATWFVYAPDVPEARKLATQATHWELDLNDPDDLFVLAVYAGHVDNLT